MEDLDNGRKMRQEQRTSEDEEWFISGMEGKSRRTTNTKGYILVVGGEK